MVLLRSRFIAFSVLISLMGMSLSFSSFGQQYTFIQYSLREGLAQSQVRCLYQDSKGYIWAGTLGGASKFNGKKFINYDRSKGLSNNQVNTIIELNTGQIAMGLVGGIAIIEGDSAVSYLLPEGMSDVTVNTLYTDEEGKLWIGTEKGLCYLNESTVQLFESEKAPFRSHIKAFKKGAHDALIIAKEAVYTWDYSSASIFYQPENSDINFFDAETNEDGSLWLATKGSGLILRKNNGDISLFGEENGLTTTTVTGICKTSDQEVWMSSRFGFFHLQNGKIEAYTEEEGLNTPDIRDVLQDREGNIWLATYGSGILRFTGNAIATYTVSDGLSSDAVMSITEDREGNIWFSTFDMGLCKQQGDTIVRIPLAGFAGSNRVWTSITDRSGTLWFGSSDGLFTITNRKFQPSVDQDSLPERTVLSLFQDSSNRIWIGTSGGLCYFSDGHIRTFNDVSNAPLTRVRGIKEDLSGNIWMTTREGVYKWSPAGFEFFNETSGLPDLSAYCIEVDAYNHIWVGTQNGIAIYENGSFQNIVIDGTPGSKTVNFIKSFDGRMWIGTLQGVYSTAIFDQIDPGNIQFTNYVLEDGVRSLETNLNAVFADSRGYLWIGTPEGVMKVNTSRLVGKPRTPAPLVHLTRILINLAPPNWRKLGANIDPIRLLPNDLSVSYGNNHFTFYFDGISTTYPEEVRFQFMLEGFDGEWQALTNIDFAIYSNLPYSSFTFKVRALSKSGEWSEIVSFPFVIRPPFWLTWWFILLEILAGAAIVGAVVWSRNRIVRARYEKQQFEMRSKMLVLEQQSLNSSMNRHFIFNALNSIQYYINRQDRLAANRYLSDFAKLIRKNLDSSQENLTTLREEVERLELYLKLEHMRFKDKFEYEIRIDPTLDQDTTKVPAMLVQPFLENSIWHGLLPKEAPGHLYVDVTKEGGMIRFDIMDDGVGIEQSLKSKTGTDNHISKGMQITGNRIELIRRMTGQLVDLQGPYELKDASGSPAGTRVVLVIPVNFNELFSH